MKKVLLILSFILCAAFVLSVGYVWTNRVEIVSNQLSKALGLKVVLEDVSLSLNSVTLRNIRIYNPPGASFITAMSAQQLKITASPLQIFNQHIYIDSVELQNPEFGLELFSPDLKNSSWSRVIQSMSRKNTPTVKKAPTHTWEIGTFVATNIQVRAKSSLLGSNAVNLPSIPKIELHNIGANKSLDYQQVLGIVLEALSDKIQEPTLIKEVYQKVKGASDKILEKVFKK